MFTVRIIAVGRRPTNQFGHGRWGVRDRSKQYWLPSGASWASVEKLRQQKLFWRVRNGLIPKIGFHALRGTPIHTLIVMGSDAAVFV